MKKQYILILDENEKKKNLSDKEEGANLKRLAD